MSNENYTPIDCGDYSEYEVHILHRDQLRLHWKDDQGEHHVSLLTPTDLRTEASKEEFLIGKDSDGNIQHIRLDRIKKREKV